jgi:hypothetical protein
MKPVKYFDAMVTLARARKYLSLRPCYKIWKWSKLENARILMRFSIFTSICVWEQDSKIKRGEKNL